MIHPSAIFTEEKVKGIPLKMILVQKGAFIMGSDEHKSEQPIHSVTIEKDFWLAPIPVTQALWEAVMGPDEDRFAFAGAQRPVEVVSWHEAREFIKKLNKQTQLTYRLPSEAEWEFAARGGNSGKENNYRYAGSNDLHEVGWYDDNSHDETKPVGLKRPNALGLYDMSGNVWEWVEDDWHGNYEGAPSDGRAWSDRGESARKVLRGGGWSDIPIDCRSTDRDGIEPGDRSDYIGFRLAASPLV